MNGRADARGVQAHGGRGDEGEGRLERGTSGAGGGGESLPASHCSLDAEGGLNALKGGAHGGKRGYEGKGRLGFARPNPHIAAMFIRTNHLWNSTIGHMFGKWI